MRGSKYRNADLHIHTPASKCYEDRSASALDIVAHALGKDLEIIAVTDHNTAAWVEKVREAAKDTGLHVFPGVEITTKDAHILAIFDLKTEVAEINDLLARVGIVHKDHGSNDAVGAGLEKVLSEIQRAGGIAIAPHANSSNGLFKHPKGTFKQKVCARSDLLALEFSKRGDIEKFSTGEVPGYPKKACLQGSDAHNLEKIGSRYTLLKIDHISLSALRQALLDHQVKVRFPWDNIEPSMPRVASLSFSQGFFEDVLFDFHPHLNCLVGGKGVGKSTAIELLRYTFDQLSEFPDIQEDAEGKALALVGAGGLISAHCIDDAGENFVIERRVARDHGEAPVCCGTEGNQIPIPFVPVFFSQGELARVAGNHIAQLSLVDRYIDVGDESTEEHTLLPQLQTNASKIDTATQHLAAAEAIVTDPNSGRDANAAEIKRLEKALKKPILRDFPKWEVESAYLDQAVLGLDDAQRRLAEVLDELELVDLFDEDLPEDTPTEELQSLSTELPVEVQALAESSLRTFTEGLKALKKQISGAKKKWRPKFSTKKRQYQAALSQSNEKTVTLLENRLREAKRRQTQLEKNAKKVERESKQLKRLWTVRTTLLKDLALCREQRYKKRSEIIDRWNKVFDGRVRIELGHLADRQAYADALKRALGGSWVQEPDQAKIFRGLLPAELAREIRNESTEGLREAGLSSKSSRKVLGFLGARPHALFELEQITIDDAPHIEFQVESGTYKPLKDLSTGGKATVLILLALAEGNRPLIIDQPEDSLDSVFIYEEIVQRVREGKEDRQFLFATHNPNMLVAADADLSFVLAASAEKGEITSHGGLDRKRTRELLLLHLEGGDDAFAARGKKYGG